MIEPIYYDTEKREEYIYDPELLEKSFKDLQALRHESD